MALKEACDVWRSVDVKLAYNVAPVIGDRVWLSEYGWLRVEKVARTCVTDKVTGTKIQGWNVSPDLCQLCFYADGTTVHVQKPVYIAKGAGLNELKIDEKKH